MNKKDYYISLIHLIGAADNCKKKYKVSELEELSQYRLKVYYQNAVRDLLYMMDDIELR